MGTEDLIELLEEGIESGRISPYLATYIAASELKVWPDETNFSELPAESNDRAQSPHA